MERFNGDGGRALLIEALRDQRIVRGDRDAAEALASALEIRSYKAGDVLVAQGEVSNGRMYFILTGAVSIFINDREIAKRERKQTVGEMGLVEATACRSATLKVAEPSLLGEISEPEFTKIAAEFPDLWRELAKDLAERLRQRNARERHRNEKPVIFLGSSSESASVLAKLESELNTDSVELSSWTSPDLFKPSDSTIESLEEAAFKSDFAVLIFGPDDVVLSRDEVDDAPRDNVVFELGLFMGATGRKRTFVVEPSAQRLKIPSDLKGVTTLRYKDDAELKKIDPSLVGDRDIAADIGLAPHVEAVWIDIRVFEGDQQELEFVRLLLVVHRRLKHQRGALELVLAPAGERLLGGPFPLAMRAALQSLPVALDIAGADMLAAIAQADRLLRARIVAQRH